MSSSATAAAAATLICKMCGKPGRTYSCCALAIYCGKKCKKAGAKEHAKFCRLGWDVQSYEGNVSNDNPLAVYFAADKKREYAILITQMAGMAKDDVFLLEEGKKWKMCAADSQDFADFVNDDSGTAMFRDLHRSRAKDLGSAVVKFIDRKTLKWSLYFGQFAVAAAYPK